MRRCVMDEWQLQILLPIFESILFGIVHGLVHPPTQLFNNAVRKEYLHCAPNWTTFYRWQESWSFSDKNKQTKTYNGLPRSFWLHLSVYSCLFGYLSPWLPPFVCLFLCLLDYLWVFGYCCIVACCRLVGYPCLLHVVTSVTLVNGVPLVNDISLLLLVLGSVCYLTSYLIVFYLFLLLCLLVTFALLGIPVSL